MKKLVLIVSLALIAPMALAGSASADHSWGGYHWARTQNPFTLKLGDNVSGPWDAMLTTASNDWTTSDVLNTTVVTGGTRPKSCRATSGRVEVCSARYGNTGWLGLAQIWITGGEHIVQGIVKNNDYYFGSSSYQYNNTAEMQHVICQEIGHTLGLDHQSTDGTSLDTCMDYYHNTSSSDKKSTDPNAGDYAELQCIYDPGQYGTTITTTVNKRQGGSYTHTCTRTGHLDSSSTVGTANSSLPNAAPSSSPAWHVSQSRYVEQLPNGVLLVTWITWAS